MTNCFELRAPLVILLMTGPVPQEGPDGLQAAFSLTRPGEPR